jgi:hypothetical protein
MKRQEFRINSKRHSLYLLAAMPLIIINILMGGACALDVISASSMECAENGVLAIDGVCQVILYSYYNLSSSDVGIFARSTGGGADFEVRGVWQDTIVPSCAGGPAYTRFVSDSGALGAEGSYDIIARVSVAGETRSGKVGEVSCLGAEGGQPGSQGQEEGGAGEAGAGEPDGGPACSSALQCDDGNACTEDACAGGRCVHTGIAGCEGGGNGSQGGNGGGPGSAWDISNAGYMPIAIASAAIALAVLLIVIHRLKPRRKSPEKKETK